jgi:hypothetical protein
VLERVKVNVASKALELSPHWFYSHYCSEVCLACCPQREQSNVCTAVDHLTAKDDEAQGWAKQRVCGR